MSVLSAEDRGDMAEALLPVAANLVLLVHGDGGPEDVQAVLDGLSEAQRTALLVVLAGLVDPDQSMGRALGWLEHDEAGRPVVPVWGEKRTVRDLAPADEDEDLAGDGFVDPVAVQRFVAGWPVGLTEGEYLEALRACFGRGMTCAQVDGLRQVPAKTTENAINRLRKAYARRGQAFPSLERVDEVRKFTEAEVVAIRRRSAGGGTDLEIAMSYGVHRKAITNVVSGHSYRNFGGPIRPKKENRPGRATRVIWGGSKPSFAEAAAG